MHMKLLSRKRGEEFVEAAIVLPLMILTILSMIMVAVFLYSHNLRQAETHVGLMKEIESSKSIFAVKRKSVTTAKDIRGTYKAELSRDSTIRAYVIRQADVIRTGSLAEDRNAE